jgi:hypothetical protein
LCQTHLRDSFSHFRSHLFLLLLLLSSVLHPLSEIGPLLQHDVVPVAAQLIIIVVSAAAVEITTRDAIILSASSKPSFSCFVRAVGEQVQLELEQQQPQGAQQQQHSSLSLSLSLSLFLFHTLSMDGEEGGGGGDWLAAAADTAPAAAAAAAGWSSVARLVLLQPLPLSWLVRAKREREPELRPSCLPPRPLLLPWRGTV